MRFYLALYFAKIINFLINIVDKSRGSNLSGQYAMKIDPLMVKHFKGINPDKVLFITGTNGKSTTNNLIAHIFKENHKVVVSNLEGANLIYGVATTLSKAASLTGRVKADYFIFETDERFLPIIHKQLPAKNVLITNLQKDQVQRNGDPDFIFRKLYGKLDGEVRYFLNNDEPRTKAFEDVASEIVTYGVERHRDSFTKPDSFPGMACPKCRGKIHFNYFNNDGVGNFVCQDCGHRSNDRVDYLAENIDFDEKTFTLDGVKFNMPYDMPFMIYNYAAAIAIAKEFGGINISDVVKCFNSFENIGGRYEVLDYKGKTIKYMRIKQENPETLQSCINIMAQDKEEKMVCLGLCPLVDIIPHYTNTFYAFDCDFSELVNSGVERYYCFSPYVCYDTANRLIYEGVPEDMIHIRDNEEVQDLFDEIDQVKTDNIYLITWLNTWDKMKDMLRKGGTEDE
ncbi:MAG: MurT ligase domain-containing protein [Clostridia bacterium]|nr:MurT ligase domain-containing protein [Clostridia bacterium]